MHDAFLTNISPCSAEKKRRTEEAQQAAATNGTAAQRNGGTSVSLLIKTIFVSLPTGQSCLPTCLSQIVAWHFFLINCVNECFYLSNMDLV